MTNKDKLLRYFYDNYKNWAFKTSEIIKWGVDNYSNRSCRDARQLAEDGYLQRITDDDEKAHFGHFGKEDSYILTEKGKAKAKELGQQTLF